MKTIIEKCAENIHDEIGKVFIEKNRIRVAHHSIDIFINILEKEISTMRMITSPLCVISQDKVKEIKRKIFNINQDKTLAKLSLNEANEVVITCDLFLGKNTDNKFVFNKCLYSVIDVLSAFNE
ncbi:MAG: hypothetical protein PHD21_03080 [Flavobacteriales bacterium]|nr:hypothetical protein [Flavobacteriales bacterium]